MTGPLHSALDPQGPEAAGIAEIAWVLFGGGAVIFALVLGLAALALFAPRRWMAERRFVAAGGIVLPVVLLSALLIYTLRSAPRPAADGPADVQIEVIGLQWWWRVAYLKGADDIDFLTANEIRVPVGRVVEVRLRSADVLHSFWVPALAGKLDLIPGRDNRLRLTADRPGVFRGQCAEYCGGPHAQMAFLVIAEAPESFEAWRRTQRAPQAGPREGEAGRGSELFLAHCATCHTVRGTAAEGKLGPDLTHFASRRSLGAALLPNQPDAVAEWVAGSQHLKPGNLMPEFRAFDGEQMRALVAYLGSLE